MTNENVDCFSAMVDSFESFVEQYNMPDDIGDTLLNIFALTAIARTNTGRATYSTIPTVLTQLLQNPSNYSDMDSRLQRAGGYSPDSPCG